MGVSLKLSINEDFTISKESEYGNIKLINEKKDDEFGYIDFSGYKIPYVKRTTILHLLSDPIDTGKILGLSNKDEYGYYDEIFVESYREKIKRYYPTNDWADWTFIHRCHLHHHRHRSKNVSLSSKINRPNKICG